MIEIATAINTFGPSPKADFVPTSEQLITLTYGQLQDLVTQAVSEAIQPLQDEITQLKATVNRQDERIAASESTEEHDVSRLALDIAYDRQRLAKLEKIEPQPLQRDRGEILRALLAANGGKMLAKEARQKMRMDKATFSRLLDALKDYIDIKPFHQDKRQLVLMLKIS
jgi:uncharacterized membrane protein